MRPVQSGPGVRHRTPQGGTSWSQRRVTPIIPPTGRRPRRQGRAHGGRTPRLFDFGCLEAAAGCGASATSLSRLLGIDTAQLHRWRRHGLTDDQADQLAVRAGFHPAEVWGEWWWAQVEAEPADA
jgi:hypothetical protein